eukprot:sb/3479299/
MLSDNKDEELNTLFSFLFLNARFPRIQSTETRVGYTHDTHTRLFQNKQSISPSIVLTQSSPLSLTPYLSHSPGPGFKHIHTHRSHISVHNNTRD